MRKCLIIFTLCLVMLMSVSSLAESATATLQELYSQAELQMAQGNYVEAANQFDALGPYSDASQMAMYCKAVEAAENHQLFSIAVSAFQDLGSFKDSVQMASYYTARGLEASAELTSLATENDETLQKSLSRYRMAVEEYTNLALFKDCLIRLGNCQGRADEISVELERRKTEQLETAYLAAVTLEENGEYQKAIDAYKEIIEYKDSRERISACEAGLYEPVYQNALALKEQGNYLEAAELFSTIESYRDSKDQIKACRDADRQMKEAYHRMQLEPYYTSSGKTTSDFPLFDGFVLGETHAQFLRKAKAAGLKDQEGYYDHRAASQGGFGWYYWEKNTQIEKLGKGDVYIYFSDKEYNDNMKSYCILYRFGGYGTKNAQSIEKATANFKNLNEWLTNLYGEPTYTEDSPDSLILLPTIYHYTPVGTNYKVSQKEKHAWSGWIFRLEDGSCMLISNYIGDYSGENSNQVSFVLYDPQTVKESCP